jgi:hypothetical protein
MRVRGLTLSALLLSVPALVAAQSNPQCTQFSAYAQTENLCNGVVDATHYLQPQLGLGITGGNPIVGSFRPLGGLGHFSLGIRVTAFKTALPDFSSDGSTPVTAKDTSAIGAPTFDIAAGVYRGMSHGLLAVDLLGSVVAVPNSIDHIKVDPAAASIGQVSYKIGYGARIGILRGTFPIPSVTASWMHREIPRVTVGDTLNGDNFAYEMVVKSTSMRLMAGWHVLFFDIGGGVGHDKYSGESRIFFNDPNPGSPGVKVVPIPFDVGRSTVFADIGMNLLFLKIGGEIGKQGGNDLTTTSQFQGFDVKKGFTYASANVRFQF